MLSLLLTLSLSQAEPTPPPMVPSEEVRLATPQRSARLTAEPQVGTGALVGRTLMATLGGVVGSGLATGVVLLSFAVAGGGWSGLAIGFVLAVAMSPLAAGLVVAGVAAGAALFGENFGRDFRDALTVSGIAVPLAAAAAVLLVFLGVPLLAFIPAIVATVATPLIVQARKPELRRPEPSPLAPAGGLTLAF